MTINMYETRTMLQALEQIPSPRTFLRDTFFGGVKTHDTKHVDIDIVKGKRKIAAFVKPISEGRVVENEGFETKTFTPPYLKEKKRLTPQELFNRPAGSVIYAPGDGPEARAQKELGTKLAELEDRFTRREEVMAAELMNSGLVTVTGEGINAVVDFGMPAAHKVTLIGTDLWTDAASDPLTDLIDWCLMIGQASGLLPNTAILGIDVWKALRSNAKFTAALDNRRIINGQIDPRVLPNGVSYLGSINESGVDLDLYTYAEWYVDPVTSNELPMVPADKLWLGNPAARCKRLYGAIEDLDAGGLAAVERFAKSWVVPDPSVRWLLLQSAPLVAMLQPDAFGSMKVV